jgi:hypothetical protein
MKTIRTNQLKPNPAGKDRSKSGAMSEAQLAAEWVDIKNVGRIDVNLAGVTLFHKAFKPDGSFEWEAVRQLSGILPAGNVLRIHSGKGPHSIVRDEDKAGSDYFMFTGESRYIWNNDFGDTSHLWEPATKSTIDQANYDPYPPGGMILVRISDKLVAPVGAGRR